MKTTLLVSEMSRYLADMSIEELSLLAKRHFKTFMQDKPYFSKTASEPGEKYFEAWGESSTMINTPPENFSHLLLFWLYDNMCKHPTESKATGKKPEPCGDKTAKMLMQYIDLYAFNISFDEDDEDFILDFSEYSQDETFIGTTKLLYKIFNKEHAEEIQGYEQKRAAKQQKVQDFFESQVETYSSSEQE